MSTNFYAVDSVEEDYWEGVFLGKRAGGWKFQFKWHGDGEYYRNFDELVDFITKEPHVKVIKDEYGTIYSPEKFLEIVREWNEENRRVPENDKNTWCIDGYYFIKGSWC